MNTESSFTQDLLFTVSFLSPSQRMLSGSLFLQHLACYREPPSLLSSAYLALQGTLDNLYPIPLLSFLLLRVQRFYRLTPLTPRWLLLPSTLPLCSEPPPLKTPHSITLTKIQLLFSHVPWSLKFQSSTVQVEFVTDRLITGTRFRPVTNKNVSDVQFLLKI